MKRFDESATRVRIKEEVTELILTGRGAGDVSRVQFAKGDWKRDLEERKLRD
ncbi:MAG: hypothetical protein Q8J74_04640 [Candidatus Didemnitutus sp.]|nr:hypothetical protein [Candidatus Didemnitutus sp.]